MGHHSATLVRQFFWTGCNFACVWVRACAHTFRFLLPVCAVQRWCMHGSSLCACCFSCVGVGGCRWRGASSLICYAAFSRHMFFFCLIGYLVLFTVRCFCKLIVWINSAADFGSVYWTFDNLGRGRGWGFLPDLGPLPRHRSGTTVN